MLWFFIIFLIIIFILILFSTKRGLQAKQEALENFHTKQIEEKNLILAKLTQEKSSTLNELTTLKNEINCKNIEIENLQRKLAPRLALLEVAGSNLTAIPYMAKIMADYETYGIADLAASLRWGYDKQRLKKVKSIREIRKDAQQIVEKNKASQYQLAYLLELYPRLQDVIDCDFKELPTTTLDELSDPAASFLSKEEYSKLSEREKNQLALDNYIHSFRKTPWQIGRDYELFVGYQYEQQNFKVDYYGSNNGIEDLGRDLIIYKENGSVLVVQCKYWGANKTIHEKHITQLYGTTMCYCLEHNLSKEDVTGVLITNIKLSPMAIKMAELLNIKYKENYAMGTFPRIKCNNGKDEYGLTTKIYHLPFDQQYDKIKFTSKKDQWAFTIKEAEAAGYRRAKKWLGD